MSRHSKPSTRGVGRFTRLRYTRLRAILAGALVLGVGATVTLASWNDSESAKADFIAGTFDIVGSVDGVAFGSHGGATPAAVLNFPAGVMAPGQTKYALFAVKTADTSVAGAVSLAATPSGIAPETDLGPYLTYGVKNLSAGNACTAANYADPAKGAVVIDAGTPLTQGQSDGKTLAVGGPSKAQVNYCFAVTMPATVDNAAQGKSAAPKWTVNAVSTAS